ncbi:hypothetical protein K466DRAFT_498475, partial [Polyporus arcularius HHB13444]
DDIDPITGEWKDPQVVRVKYAQAQKMRAALSHKFCRDFKISLRDWVQDPLKPGSYLGNPALAHVVNQYMTSLRRRKARAGEVVTSARAVDHIILKQLYDFNMAFPMELDSVTRKQKAENPAYWGGFKQRVMLETSYETSTLCLLRYDEVLRIMWEHVQFLKSEDGVPIVEIKLNCRKNAQTGNVEPFYLWPDRERPHLDPVAAWARWWLIWERMGLKHSGYVFRSRRGFDQFSSDPMDAMSFRACFQNNLADIGIDGRPFGMHSFRRGGCQYLATELRWPIRTICEWGGWAEDFDNPGTIFRYLLSWVDAPKVARKDYFNPNRKAGDPCTACGRTCPCA